MNSLRAALAATLAALFLLVGLQAPASADPAPITECTSIEGMNCRTTVLNIRQGDVFCQITATTKRCERYWPFRNPEVNMHAADGDPGAFPRAYYFYWGEYLTQKDDLVRQGDLLKRRAGRIEQLEVRAARKQARIERLQARVARLQHRLHSR